MTTPSTTPNVVVQDPRVRKVVGNVLAVATVVLAIVIMVDGYVPAFDIAWITTPALGISGGLFSIFQLAVTSPNVPTEAVEARRSNF